MYAIKACSGSRGVGPLILNLGARLIRVVNFTFRPLYPWELTPVSSEYQLGVDVSEKRETSLLGFEPFTVNPSHNADWAIPALTWSK